MATGRKKLEIIGVSGVPGSFSEEAARQYVRRAKLKHYKLEYLVTVENVLAALERGDITRAVFPVANSTMGIVLEALQAISKYNFSIKKVFPIDVHQNLLVKKGTKTKDVKRIVSQLPALQQCESYLKRTWPKTKVSQYKDTAKAAKDLAAGKLSSSTAVIASRHAARLYGLDVLEGSIQDHKNNNTSFVAATR